MPSCITHQLIAEYAEQSFPPEALSAISEARAYYFLGAQGPDLLFFYRVLSGKENNLGRLLHRKHRYAVFSAFYDLLRGDFFRGEAREKAAAYIYGYLTHYCADVAFHPFVYAYLEAHSGEGFLHQKIENDWDVYFLREKRGREAEDYTFPFSVKRIADDGVLYLLFSFAFARINGTALSQNGFSSMLKLFGGYLNFFHGECYSSQRGWKKAEDFFGAKPRFSRLFPSRTPEKRFLYGSDFAEFTEGKAQSADELFDIAVNESARLAELFCNCLKSGEPLPKTPFNLSFHSGKEE